MPPGPELSCEELRALLFAFEGSDEPEVIKTVFSRLCEFFAWAAHRGIDAVPCRDCDDAVPLRKYAALFTSVVALRMTGQDGKAEEPPRGPLKVIEPNQALGWANPPNRPPDSKYARIERDYAMAACVELFERRYCGRDKRTYAIKRVAAQFACKPRRVQAALSFFAQVSPFVFRSLSNAELEEIRSGAKPFPPRHS